MWIMKLLLKILILPLMGILLLVRLVGKVAAHISSYVVAVGMLVLAICLIVFVCDKNLHGSLATVGFAAAGYGVVFLFAFIDMKAGDASHALMKFLVS